MKATLLLIETATPVCSVCICCNERIIASAHSEEPNSHAKMLAVLIQKVLSETGLKTRELSAVGVSEGPGSYTGLRIGLSTAKGICYASHLPLILVPTLAAMAHGMKKYLPPNFVLLPALDARRNDVYFSLFDEHLNELISHDCKSVSEVNALLENMNLKAIAAGTGIEKFQPFAGNITLLQQNVIDAANMAPIAHQKFIEKKFADLAYSEPIYRK